jgi:hypothetical protein
MKRATVRPTDAIEAAMAKSPVLKPLVSGAMPNLEASSTRPMIPTILPATRAKKIVRVSGPTVLSFTPALASVKKNLQEGGRYLWVSFDARRTVSARNASGGRLIV